MTDKKYCFSGKNYDSNFLKTSFLRGMAFGKSVVDFDTATAIMSVKNKNDVLLAVKKAYIDMSPRTFKGLKQTNAWKEGKTEIFDWLANQFLDYFENGWGNFDKRHEELCDEFLKKFGKLLKEHGCVPETHLKYGKAQKIVNMTFKYLFCFDDAKSDDFNLCHMPVDSYILKWYKDISGNRLKNCWSNLEKDEYQQIQNKIKELLGDGFTPLKAEFYIWVEYNH